MTARSKRTKRARRRRTSAAVSTGCLDASPPTVKVGRRLIEVETLAGVRTALVRIIDGIGRRTLDPKQGNAMIYGVNSLVRIFEVQSLEARIAALEQADPEGGLGLDRPPAAETPPP